MTNLTICAAGAFIERIVVFRESCIRNSRTNRFNRVAVRSLRLHIAARTAKQQPIFFHKLSRGVCKAARDRSEFIKPIASLV